VSKPAANPYRVILRRHLPEPLLALLIFVMGVWLWDNHFGHKIGYEAGVGRMALRKIDRDLRLAEEAGGLPAPLRSLLSIPTRAEALDGGILSLRTLAAEQSLDAEGAYALGMLETLRRESSPDPDPAEAAVVLPAPPDARALVARVAHGEDAVWDREYLRRLGNMSPGEDSRNREMALRVYMARGAVWLLAIAGLAYLPSVARGWWQALKSRGRGYPSRWPVTLGLGVFLMAYLASIGFGKSLDLAISGSWSGEGGQPLLLAPGWFALLDAGTRFLPAFIACAFLFRRCRHAATRLGLSARPEFGLVLGSFALLTLVDQVMRHTLGQSVPTDPSGGLSEMEAGPWGLVLAVTSACIAAPVAEEILYRGVLFRSLANGIRVAAATLISAAVFALVHFYDAYGLLSVGSLGVACALGFAVSGRLTTAILLHALYNSAIKIPEWIVYHAPL
jgi:membrane protease YdiL (CAAX protease family)